MRCFRLLEATWGATLRRAAVLIPAVVVGGCESQLERLRPLVLLNAVWCGPSAPLINKVFYKEKEGSREVEMDAPRNYPTQTPRANQPCKEDALLLLLLNCPYNLGKSKAKGKKKALIGILPPPHTHFCSPFSKFPPRQRRTRIGAAGPVPARQLDWLIRVVSAP